MKKKSIAVALFLAIAGFPFFPSIARAENVCYGFVKNIVDVFNLVFQWKMSQDEKKCVTGNLYRAMQQNVECEGNDISPDQIDEMIAMPWQLYKTYKHPRNQSRRAEIRTAIKEIVNSQPFGFTTSDMQRLKQQCRATKGKVITPRYSVGTYVTNKGVSQNWIGRVVGADTKTYEVRITYANEYSDFEKGETVKVTEGELKELTAVSVDASLKGFK